MKMVTPTETRNAFELAQQLAADFATRAADADRAGALPAEDVAALKDSRYFALSIPEKYGGWGLSMREVAEAQIALAQGSPSTALVAAMPLQVFGHQRELNRWPEEKYAEFARLTVEERALFNSIASEPKMGSPSRGHLFATAALLTPDGDAWVINGRKTWSTGGRHLTHLLVRASTDDGPGQFVVRNNIAGIEWVETWGDALSLRASDSHDVIFNDVTIPYNNFVVIDADRDRKSIPNAWFPMILAAVYLGAAIAARDTVIRYALERVPTSLGKPIATLPKIQRQIGEIDLALQAAQTLFLTIADEWNPDRRQALMSRIVSAKHLAVETANDVTEKALRIAGGTGVTTQLPLERYFRDVRAGLHQPPSGDTALEIIGRAAVDRLDYNIENT